MCEVVYRTDSHFTLHKLKSPCVADRMERRIILVNSRCSSGNEGVAVRGCFTSSEAKSCRYLFVSRQIVAGYSFCYYRVKVECQFELRNPNWTVRLRPTRGLVPPYGGRVRTKLVRNTLRALCYQRRAPLRRRGVADALLSKPSSPWTILVLSVGMILSLSHTRLDRRSALSEFGSCRSRPVRAATRGARLTLSHGPCLRPPPEPLVAFEESRAILGRG